MWAFFALSTTGTVSPYLGVVPTVQSEIARSTLNSAQKTGSCATSGRQPPSGLMPFSL